MTSSTPTPLPGLGATLQNGGCVYRIWAPFAEQVMLRGDFFHSGNNDMLSFDDIQMKRDTSAAYGNAYWSVFVEGALADSLYKFFITNSTARPDMHMPPNGGWKLDPYSRDATSFDGNSVVVDRDFDWSGDNFQMPGWNQMVIYELHVGSFNRPASGAIGSFADVIPKLDYLAALGINVIQVLPALDFDTTTSMGYNPALPFAVDNAYGTVKTFKSFIKAAHQVGIAVILDVVYNHFGGDGLDQCLSRIDGWWVNDTRGLYFFPDTRIWTPYGDNRPDLGRGEVRQYIRDNAMTFLSEFHLDGLRLDSTIAIRHYVGGYGDNGDLPEGWTLLRWLGEEKRASQPWKILIAEDLQNDSSITRDALFGGMGLDSQWDSWFLGRLRDMMFAANDDSRSTQSVVEAIGKSYNYAGFFQRVIYVESHDQANHLPRLPDIISLGNANGWYARKLSTLAAALTFTSPGIPMFFMGQEFLEYRPWKDDQNFTSLDWSRTISCGGIVEVYRRLIQLRRNWNNNTRGLQGSNINIFHADPNTGVIAFHRWDQGGGGDDVIVVANIKGGTLGSYNIGFPRPGNWFLRFNSDWAGYWSDYGNVGFDTTADWGWNQNMPCNGNIGIGPYSVQILSQ